MEQISNFTPASLKFLAALAKNNRRDWFQPRKAEFEQLVLEPMRALAQLINQQLEQTAPAYALPESHKALNRIYRDVRFSADKTPYQDHVSALFPRHKLSKKQGAAFFVSISGKEAMLAGGMYFGETRDLQAVRMHLADEHARFTKLLAQKARKAMFGELQGEKLLRVPRQFGSDHAAAELLRHKQWMLWKKWTSAEVIAGGFAKEVLEGVKLLAPLVEFLNEPLLKLPPTVLTDE